MLRWILELIHVVAFGKYQIDKLISRHRVTRYELVGLIFLENRKNVVQILEYSVTANISNSNVLLMDGSYFKKGIVVHGGQIQIILGVLIDVKYRDPLTYVIIL